MNIKRALASLTLSSVLLAACGGLGANRPSNPTRGPLPTLADLPQRPQSDVIAVDNVPQIQLLGNLIAHDSTVNRIEFSHDSHLMLTLDAESIAIVWDLETRRQRFRLGGKALFAFFSADDRAIITVSAQGQVEFRSVEDGQVLGSAPGNQEGIFWAARSPDSTMLATGGVRGDVMLWDLATREVRLRIPGSGGNVRHLAFAPDGETLAAIINEPEALGGVVVRIWRTGTGNPVTALRGFPAGEPRRLAFSPDGALLAVAARSQVQMYETGTYTRRYALEGEDLFADQDIGFSPDGRLFAALGRSRFVYVWEAADGQPVASLPGHDRSVAALAFSPNSQLLLTTNVVPRMGAFVWQTQAMQPGAERLPHGTIGQETNGILTGAWSPDGRLLVLAEASGGLMLWGIPGVR